MMVPRSFKHGVSASSPPPSDHEEREKIIVHKPPASSRSLARTSHSSTTSHHLAMARRPDQQKRIATDPILTPSKSVEIPERTRSPKAQRDVQNPHRSARQNSTASTTKCSESVPASVAALLAMTTIPPRRADHTRRRRTAGVANMSIDELVRHWKSDHTLRPSMSSSPSMSMLLEDSQLSRSEGLGRRKRSETAVPSFSRMSRTRSVSSDSVPSLEGDESSVQSVRTPSTPDSLRSRRSLSYFKRDKFKSASLGEDCLFDHPLILPPPLDSSQDKDLPDDFQTSKSVGSKSRSSFSSNLTTSLQALKAAALSSISSLTSSNSNAATTRATASPSLIDDALWSHPFLFPRLSSEMRPTIQGTPTKAQRRYLNPMPLMFEEQEVPFQRALHAPYLAEAVCDAPVIQLQPYARNRRRSAGKGRSTTPDVQSEAGRAQLMTSGIRQREPRENADFLRVVVLEMNMRRAGKLDTGRARIWLAPRQVYERSEEAKEVGKVPLRWQSIDA